MTLADLARQEGIRSKASAADWLRERPELCQELFEMRDGGFTYSDLTRLLRKHYEFPFNNDQLRKAMNSI